MNNNRSPVEQSITFALLILGAFLLFKQFYGTPNNGNNTPPKPAPALALAFAGLDPAGPSPLNQTTALAEIKKQQAAIASNGSDDGSYWSRLRVGLIQQYVLKSSTDAIKSYDEVIHRRKNEEVDAQALYQKGDLLYRQSEQPLAEDGKTQITPEKKADLESKGVTELEQIPFRARGHQDFLKYNVWVPDTTSARGDPMQLPKTWEQKSLHDLLGITGGPNASGGIADPRFILARIDTHYSKTPLYKIFDTVVKWYGANPAFSYGLALITLALITRLLMQPLIKKQYDSMKGMQLIAPEMKKIQDRYKGKTDQESQMRMMKEIRELQKQHGVNPMGCGLSLVIQMPIFFFFVLPLINHSQAKMELVHAHFGWIQSLAHPDIPLLVMYAISMFVSVRLSATPPADEQQKQMQKMTTFMSPAFAIVLWSYPSAFILYWMTYNVLSTAIQWRMMKASDPTKNVFKTLMGTGTPAPVSVPAAGTSDGVIPPRPSGKVKTITPSLNGTAEESSNGVAVAQSPMETHGASNSNGAANAARRRRRRK